MGAGRTELLRALFGLDPVVSGRVKLGAYARAGDDPERWAQGLALVSENRKEEGLALGLSVADNLTLSKMPAVVRPSERRPLAARWIERLDVRCQSPDQPVGELSGGNQQKVAIARLLHHGVDVLLLDEPTRGIDVGSKAQIYDLIDALVSKERARRSSSCRATCPSCSACAIASPSCAAGASDRRARWPRWSEQALVHEAALGSEAA